MANGSSASVVLQAPQAVRQAIQAGIVRVRRNVEQADIASLKDAYSKMQARSENDNRSWIFWAEYHGFNRFDCWHHSGVGSQRFPYDLFLPWHRAYLLYFERVALAANPGAVLPWWDWTSSTSHQVGVPASFSSSQAGDALASGPVPAGLRTNPNRTRRNPGSPSQLPSAPEIQSIIDNPTTFDDFSGQVQGQHDRIHGWTGGDMGVVAASAFDPIFWSHHCMIDRLWYLWQVKHGVDNIPPSYLNRTLAPWSLTVGDVLDVRQLGYTYGASRVRIQANAFNASVLQQTN
ncbi:MAG: tyrosinase family protein [Propionibacteriales bacterium]|nr:tyrosinase family protein [Propionibacteriales bacterium]